MNVMSPETGVFAGVGEGCRTEGASSSETSVRFWPWRMQGIEPEPERCGETLFHLFPQSQAGKEEVRAAAGLRS